MNHFNNFLIGFIISTLFSVAGHSRPEYAAKYRMRCTVCHISPSGGGARNIIGKTFSLRGYSANKFTAQDTISADVRMLYYQQKDVDTQIGGAGVMAGVASANLLLHSSADQSKQTRLLYSQSFGGFAPGPFDTFVLFKNYADHKIKLTPQYVLVGRFHAPFGPLTDEHRTYTKLQTLTEWRNLEMGVMLSSELTPDLHYDLAVVNGNGKNGNGFVPGGAANWGQILNLRWFPTMKNYYVGFSAQFHEDVGTNAMDTYSTSLYSVISKNNNSFIIEAVQSKGWNELVNGIVSNAEYGASIADATSLGLLFKYNYELNAKTILSYKLDMLTMNKDYPEDAYERHGVGIKYYFAPDSFLMGRLNFNEANHPLESSEQASYWLVLKTSI